MSPRAFFRGGHKDASAENRLLSVPTPSCVPPFRSRAGGVYGTYSGHRNASAMDASRTALGTTTARVGALFPNEYTRTAAAWTVEETAW